MTAPPHGRDVNDRPHHPQSEPVVIEPIRGMVALDVLMSAPRWRRRSNDGRDAV